MNNSNVKIGINYRQMIANDILNNLSYFDIVEINTERFFIDKISDDLNKLISSIPIALHGLTLSIGTEDQAIDETYLLKLDKAINISNCSWFSEHLAITSVNGIDLRSLMPTAFTHERAEQIACKVKKIKSLSKKHFLLENITYYHPLPNNELTEASFINEVTTKSDCELLLDLTNLYVNSINHKYDPLDFLNQINLDRVTEIHLAGCNYIENMLVDTHASNIRTEIFDLLSYIKSKSPIRGIIIERDANLNNFNDLIEEVKHIRSLVNH